MWLQRLLDAALPPAPLLRAATIAPSTALPLALQRTSARSQALSFRVAADVANLGEAQPPA
jgi:hypothetical protein